MIPARSSGLGRDVQLSRVRPRARAHAGYLPGVRKSS
ncbi:hypothetical protein GT002_17850 [Streptomyces sp. SID4917]|nr:hypothetical protein [Streptomyces sp. SID4917]